MTKNLIYFLGGVAAAVLTKSVACSPKTRKLCVNALAKGILTKEKVNSQIATIKQDAEDLCAEARAEAAKQA